MKFPHITRSQVLAVFVFVVGQAVAFGWLSSLKSQLVLSAGTTIIAAAWQLADAFIQSSNLQAKAAMLINGKDPKGLEQ